MMVRAMLTTIDNPHSPFDDYAAWFAFDATHGYHSSAYLARLVLTSEELSEFDQQRDIEDAIDYIISENVSGMFVKVTREFPDE
jgi:hypothetical protein